MTEEFGTSYFGVRDVNHVRADLERFSENQLNGILHTFSERDQQYYAGTMREIIAESKHSGFNVYLNPWGVGRVFGGEALSEFPSRYPNHTQLLSSGDRAPAACLNSPRFREYMSEWIEDAATLNPDLIFWDEPHWYTPRWRTSPVSSESWVCTCRFCRERFEKSFDEPFPENRTEKIISFRKESLLDFLDQMIRETSQHNLANAVCLMPEPETERTPESWELLAGHDHLDLLATTPYWALHNKEPEPFVQAWSIKIIELSEKHNLISQVWIQGFGLDGRGKTLKKHQIAIKTALDCNPDSLFVWGWDGCRTISSIAPDNPSKVWSIFLDHFS